MKNRRRSSSLGPIFQTKDLVFEPLFKKYMQNIGWTSVPWNRCLLVLNQILLVQPTRILGYLLNEGLRTKSLDRWEDWGPTTNTFLEWIYLLCSCLLTVWSFFWGFVTTEVPFPLSAWGFGGCWWSLTGSEQVPWKLPPQPGHYHT